LCACEWRAGQRNENQSNGKSETHEPHESISRATHPLYPFMNQITDAVAGLRAYKNARVFLAGGSGAGSREGTRL
jgi:hypothetical protein